MWIHFLGNLDAYTVALIGLITGGIPVMLALPPYIASLAMLIAMCHKRDRLIAWVNKPRKPNV